MVYLYLILNWFFGILFLILGLVSLTNSTLAGLLLIAISLLLLPPIRNFVYSKTNITISSERRGITIFVLFLTFNVFIINNDAKRYEIEQIEQTEKLLTQLESVSPSDYGKNESLYRQLVNLHPENEEYKSKLVFFSKKVKEEKVEELLTQLKAISSSDYEKNENIYRQLVTLNPNNQNYKSKVQFYTQKISERNEKQRLAAEQKKELEVQEDTGGMVSKSSFKGVWPLTVKEGTLACNNNAVTFKTINGEIYAVNGVAESRGAQKIDPIWKDNPNLSGTKLNISNLIEKGLSLCSPRRMR